MHSRYAVSITYLDAVIGARRKVLEGNIRIAVRCWLGQNVNDLGTRCYSSHGEGDEGKGGELASLYGQQQQSKNKEWIGMTILCRFESLPPKATSSVSRIERLRSSHVIRQ
jgi:hypothetical protein